MRFSNPGIPGQALNYFRRLPVWPRNFYSSDKDPAALSNKLIVGSEEWSSLSGLGLPAIKERVDSGAATSFLHAFNFVPFQRDGELSISFEVHLN